MERKNHIKRVAGKCESTGIHREQFGGCRAFMVKREINSHVNANHIRVKRACQHACLAPGAASYNENVLKLPLKELCDYFNERFGLFPFHLFVELIIHIIHKMLQVRSTSDMDVTTIELADGPLGTRRKVPRRHNEEIGWHLRRRPGASAIDLFPARPLDLSLGSAE